MTDSVSMALGQEGSNSIQVSVSPELSRGKPAELDDVIQITTVSGDEIEIWPHEQRLNFVRIKGAARISHKALPETPPLPQNLMGQKG